MSEEQRLDYIKLAPAGVAAMRGTERYLNVESGLETVLLELMRLRVSLLNGCEYCIGLHTHELHKHCETADRIAHVGDRTGFDGYTQRERAALAWAEEVTNVQLGHVPAEAFTAVRERFSEGETVNLTLAIASINSWNRMAIAFRAQHVQRSVVDDDGGKVAVDE